MYVGYIICYDVSIEVFVPGIHCFTNQSFYNTYIVSLRFIVQKSPHHLSLICMARDRIFSLRKHELDTRCKIQFILVIWRLIIKNERCSSDGIANNNIRLCSNPCFTSDHQTFCSLSTVRHVMGEIIMT